MTEPTTTMTTVNDLLSAIRSTDKSKGVLIRMKGVGEFPIKKSTLHNRLQSMNGAGRIGYTFDRDDDGNLVIISD